MMGVGKSTLGQVLAQESGREFVDTDASIQRLLGRSIPQIFERYGEAAFRSHETATLRRLEAGRSVIATGGGIVLRQENWLEFRRLGTTIYLEATLDLLVERLSRSNRKRPLLAIENWKQRLAELFAEREPLYRQADLRVQVSDFSQTECAQQIIQRLGEPA